MTPYEELSFLRDKIRELAKDLIESEMRVRMLTHRLKFLQVDLSGVGSSLGPYNATILNKGDNNADH